MSKTRQYQMLFMLRIFIKKNSIWKDHLELDTVQVIRIYISLTIFTKNTQHHPRQAISLRYLTGNKLDNSKSCITHDSQILSIIIPTQIPFEIICISSSNISSMFQTVQQWCSVQDEDVRRWLLLLTQVLWCERFLLLSQGANLPEPLKDVPWDWCTWWPRGCMAKGTGCAVCHQHVF